MEDGDQSIVGSARTHLRRSQVEPVVFHNGRMAFYDLDRSRGGGINTDSNSLHMFQH